MIGKESISWNPTRIKVLTDLESAVVVSWGDLMKNAPEGLIHIQDDFALDGSLDYLQVWWSIVRGRWLLVYA